MKIALITAALAASAIALPAFADAKKWDMIDANKDGSVSMEEFRTAMDKKFTDADTNGDGMLSTAEKDAKKIDMKDTNNDGSVSRDEHNAAVEAKFTAADTNGDGSLSKAEVEAMWAHKKH